MFSLAEILFPSRCIGCSKLGISICSDCRRDWHLHIYNREIEVLGSIYPVLSAVQYSPIASRVLLSAKESQIAAADLLIAKALRHSLKFFINRYGKGTLISVPSRKSAVRKRGRDFLNTLTTDIGLDLEVSTASPLSHHRKVRDQSQLNIAQRSQNISGAFAVSPQFATLTSPGNIAPNLIVIDDLITTGATLTEAIRALRTAGFTVLGAVTSCTAKPLR
jgi:predicted amidophosphoribosyltransferase